MSNFIIHQRADSRLKERYVCGLHVSINERQIQMNIPALLMRKASLGSPKRMNEIPKVLICGKPARQGKGDGCVVLCLLVKEILLKNL